MKRYFKTITAVVLAVLAVAACQKENLGEVAPDGREAEVKLTLTSPQIGTKSYADGQTVNKVFVHVYQQDAAGNLKYIAPAAAGESATPSQVVDMTDGAAKYSTRLVTGQKYTFVFWAECLGAATSPYTYDPETKTVTVNYAGVAGNDETRDAFCNVLKDVEITGAYSSAVKLYRPFAQLNFGVTSEDYAAAKAAGLEVTAAEVKLTNAATSLNLLDGTVSGAEDVTFAAAALPTETLSAAGATYKYVAMDYVLVGKAAKTLSDVTLTLTATGTQSATPEFTYSNVPLQANYRTNIVGNLFTSPAEVNITVDPAFDAPDYGVGAANLAAANEAFAKGATSVTVEEIVSSDPDVIVLPKTSEGVAITLPQAPDGKSITIKYDDTAAAGQKPQTLKVTAKNAKSITIVAPDTHVEVNGVTVGTLTATTSGSTLVVGKDVKISTLKIEQGAAEIYGNVSKIVKGENAGVVTWYVDDAANFETALNNADKVVLTADIDLVKTASLESGKTVVLDANGKTVYNTSDLWDKPSESDCNWSLVSVKDGKLTITGNGTFAAKKDDCYPVDVQDEESAVTIENGVFVGNIHAVYVESGVAYVNGGKYSVQQKYSVESKADGFVLNCYDANRENGTAMILVSGGEFANFNPGDCWAEGAHTNFLAEGYYTEKDENNNFIVKNLAKEFAQGGVITLASDCRTGYLELPQGKSLTLDLNGKRVDFISCDLEGKGFGTGLYGSLTIKGDGFFGDDSQEIIGYLFNVHKSVLAVESDAVIKCGLSCIQMQDSEAKAYIKGGEWVGGAYKDKYWTINKIDKYKDALIEVTGGKFYKFDPSNGMTENPGQNWVPDGYKSVADGDYYKVVKAE